MQPENKFLLVETKSEVIMPQPSQSMRILGMRVRGHILQEIEKIFTMDPSKMSEGEAQLKRELLLRMAPNTLPRLHEHTGEDGGEILIKQITGMRVVDDKSDGDRIQDKESKTETGGEAVV